MTGLLVHIPVERLLNNTLQDEICIQFCSQLLSKLLLVTLTWLISITNLLMNIITQNLRNSKLSNNESCFVRCKMKKGKENEHT
jgi:hypothetical protein